MNRIEKLIQRLNRKAIYVTFENEYSFDVKESAHAIYFGVEIRIFFPNTAAEIRVHEDCSADFQIEVAEQSLVHTGTCLFELFDAQAKTFDQALTIINNYIRSRPFASSAKSGAVMIC